MRPAAFVTGGSRGIGAACVRLLSGTYDVAVGYRSRERDAALLADELSGEGRTVVPVCLDVSDPDSVRFAFDFVCSHLGPINLLVTCAGVAWTGLTQDMTDAEVRRVVDTDLCGTIWCCRAALEQMLPRHQGSIVTVSSIWGLCGASCETVYSAAKAGVIGFTKALAQEVGPSGIRVNCVAPGVVRTEMLSNLSDGDLEALRQETPLERIGMPEDIAGAVRYLAEAPFVTGQVLSPNGGFVV